MYVVIVSYPLSGLTTHEHFPSKITMVIWRSDLLKIYNLIYLPTKYLQIKCYIRNKGMEGLTHLPELVYVVLPSHMTNSSHTKVTLSPQVGHSASRVSSALELTMPSSHDGQSTRSLIWKIFKEEQVSFTHCLFYKMCEKIVWGTKLLDVLPKWHTTAVKKSAFPCRLVSLVFL